MRTTSIRSPHRVPKEAMDKIGDDTPPRHGFSAVGSLLRGTFWSLRSPLDKKTAIERGEADKAAVPAPALDTADTAAARVENVPPLINADGNGDADMSSVGSKSGSAKSHTTDTAKSNATVAGVQSKLDKTSAVLTNVGD